MSRTEAQREHLRARVLELLGKQPITAQISPGEGAALDALAEAVLELVLLHIHDAGGFCDYDFHISTPDFAWPDRPDLCQACGKERAEHATHSVLLCPDELERVLQMQEGGS